MEPTYIERLAMLDLSRPLLEPVVGIGFAADKLAEAMIQPDEDDFFGGLDCECGGQLDAFGFCFKCLKIGGNGHV